MAIYPHTPSEDQAAWWELSCDLAHGMQQLGWNVFNHLPEPADPLTGRAIRYQETWDRFAMYHSRELPALIEEWCFNGVWATTMTSPQGFLLILRLLVVTNHIGTMYTGPGKWGSTLIPFPRHVAAPNLRRWWLREWFEDKGVDVLHQWMRVELWSKTTKTLTPRTRREIARLQEHGASPDSPA